MHPSVGSNGFSITGRGKVTLFANNGSNSLSSLIVDGVAILANTQLMVKSAPIHFAVQGCLYHFILYRVCAGSRQGAVHGGLVSPLRNPIPPGMRP